MSITIFVSVHSGMSTFLFMTPKVTAMCGCCQYSVGYLNNIGVNKPNIRDFVESSVNNVHKLEATGRHWLSFYPNGDKYSNINVISHFRRVQPYAINLDLVSQMQGKINKGSILRS